MKFTTKEKEMIMILKGKTYGTIFDFRSVYRDKKYAMTSLKRFVHVFKILNIDGMGKFKVDHSIISKIPESVNNKVKVTFCLKNFKCKHYPINTILCYECKHYKNDFPDEFTPK